MTKERTTLTVEKSILEKAKKQGVNISQFTETCLKQYLGVEPPLFPTYDVNEIMQEIGKLQTQLYIINEQTNIKENMKHAEAEKINKPLRKLWHYYRGHYDLEPNALKEFKEYVEIDEETLEDMLWFADKNREELNLNFTWDELKEKYEKEMK